MDRNPNNRYTLNPKSDSNSYPNHNKINCKIDKKSISIR